MFLFIDTTGDEIILGLFDENKLVDKVQKKARFRQSELLLIILDNFLKKNKIKLKNIKRIIVAKGPGSFTGTRIGVSTANALAFSLSLPIIGIKKTVPQNLEKIVKSTRKFKKINRFESVKPIYKAPPAITKKKK